MLLLDTSALLWALEGSPRLGSHAIRRLETDGRVFVSPVSIAEIVIKQMNGKLRAPDDLAARLVDQGIVELPLRLDDAIGMRRFAELSRHDPFDRLLVAQAEVNRLDLLTSDRKLLSLDRPNIIDATQ